MRLFGGCTKAILFGAILFVSTAALAQEEPITFTRDVAPILYKSCAECHRPGQIAPMSLISFEETRPWAKSIKKEVRTKAMPPWFADPAHGKFSNDKQLTQEEIMTLSRWADTGMQKGDDADLPPMPEFDDEASWPIGEPDVTYTMPEPYFVEDSLEDRYVNFVIEVGNEEDKWIQAVEMKPGDQEVVHHILAYAVKPAAPGERGRQRRSFGDDLIGMYVPGAEPQSFLPNHGKKFPAGTNIRFQIHYHKEPGPGTATTDQSTIAFKFADKPVEHPVTSLWVLNTSFRIPAGADNHPANSSFRFLDDGHIFSYTPHMHLRGKDMTYVAEYPDGRRETLLKVPNYDFDWQLSYILEEPLFIPKGTKIEVLAHFDNSADNPSNPDPTKTIRWGEASTDEMMIGFLDYTYVNRKDAQAVMAIGRQRREAPDENK